MSDLDFEQLEFVQGIDADPTPIAEREKALIDAAVRAVAASHGGIVNPNLVRKRLEHPITGQLLVYGRRLSARYARRDLIPIDEVRSDDTRGRNRGAVLNLYRLVEDPS